MEPFIYEVQQSRVLFGEETLKKVGEECELLGFRNILIIVTPEQVELGENVLGLLNAFNATLYSKAVQHVPVESVDDVMKIVKEKNIDGLVAVGGGSSIGLAKAIALDTSIPIAAVPTTYAGSEMTPIWGLTEAGIKKTGKSELVKPKTVLYDPILTTTLPKKLTVTSGVNAIAHCVEALYAENKNPIISLLAEQGIEALVKSLPKIVHDMEDLNARSLAQYGCWLGGTSLGSVGMALHHKLCHTLGGTFNLPHAETHTIVIPHVIAYNAEYAPEAMEALARALNTKVENVAQELFSLIQSLDVPVALKEIGLQESDIEKVIELATQNPYYNPRPIEKAGLEELLRNAFWGISPSVKQLAE